MTPISRAMIPIDQPSETIWCVVTRMIDTVGEKRSSVARTRGPEARSKGARASITPMRSPSVCARSGGRLLRSISFSRKRAWGMTRWTGTPPTSVNTVRSTSWRSMIWNHARSSKSVATRPSRRQRTATL